MLIDSTVVIDLVRGSEAARAWLEGQVEVLAASEVTRVEVLRGMRSPERQLVRAALDTLRWFPLDTEVATLAGEYGRRYRASHDLAIADLVIAATAEVHSLPLVTSNVRHFPMVAGLQAPYSH